MDCYAKLENALLRMEDRCYELEQQQVLKKLTFDPSKADELMDYYSELREKRFRLRQSEFWWDGDLED